MTPADLVIGKVYFVCSYAHPKYPIPEITAYVYIGKNLEADLQDNDEYYFELPESYFAEDIKAALSEDELIGYGLSQSESKMRVGEEHLGSVIETLDDVERFIQGIKQEAHYGEVFSP